ncbi:hypothetical protein SALBM311S_01845 [Streptomyces alboniger]
MLPTTFTWMVGWLFSKPAISAFTPFTSFGALQACQKVMVVSLEVSSEAPAAESDWPVQAVVRRAREAVRTKAVFRAAAGMAVGMTGSP